jgi:phosphonoacetate hydrolase
MSGVFANDACQHHGLWGVPDGRLPHKAAIISCRSKSHRMANTTVIICIDGLDPDYLSMCHAPFIGELGHKGFTTTGKALMPTVTNVNNVSMVTGVFPKVHGITSNYRLDRRSGSEYYMETAEDIMAETMFQRATRLGATSLLVTAKDKLRLLLGNSTSYSISSEQPSSWIVNMVGEPPPIYSLEVNGWVIDAANYALSATDANIVYIATTDYAMHMYRPEDTHSQEHMDILDAAIRRLVDSHPNAQVLITADHGMTSKNHMIDLQSVLTEYGLKSNVVPVIKDRYTVHHSNLGGSIFVYMQESQVHEAIAILRQIRGVDHAWTKEEASARYQLHPDRIGDIFVLGGPDVVFGNPAMVAIPENLRSHGSLHEQRVPIIGYGGKFQGFLFEHNKDIGRFVMEKILC